MGSWLCPRQTEEMPWQPLSTSFRAPELFCLKLEVLTPTSACLHPAKCGVVGVALKIANLQTINPRASKVITVSKTFFYLASWSPVGPLQAGTVRWSPSLNSEPSAWLFRQIGIWGPEKAVQNKPTPFSLSVTLSTPSHPPTRVPLNLESPISHPHLP